MMRRLSRELALDEIGAIRVVLGVDIRLDRDEQGSRRFWKLPEDRLAADDDDFVVFGDGGGRADDVLQLATVHGCLRVRSIAQRSRDVSTPANGETCRKV